MNTQTITTIVNGVDPQALGAIIENATENPALALCRFRARNTWVSGAHNRTSIQGFYAGGGEDTSRKQPFSIESDEPPLVLGENHGANAVEIALAALASCLTGTLAYYGAAMGIELEEVSAELEGSMDMRGMLGVDESTRNGLQHIRVVYRIKSPEPRERVLELLGVAQKASPLYDIMTNPVPFSLSLVS
jgi:uncharacterized OsmC-like protein